MSKIHVALIGPIRPNMDYILYLIKKLKIDIPQVITHISYWKTNINDKWKNNIGIVGQLKLT